MSRCSRCLCEGCLKVGVDGHNQYGVAQDRPNYANPFHLRELLGVPRWSQVLLFVAV